MTREHENDMPEKTHTSSFGTGLSKLLSHLIDAVIWVYLIRIIRAVSTSWGSSPRRSVVICETCQENM